MIRAFFLVFVVCALIGGCTTADPVPGGQVTECMADGNC